MLYDCKLLVKVCYMIVGYSQKYVI